MYVYVHPYVPPAQLGNGQALWEVLSMYMLWNKQGDGFIEKRAFIFDVTTAPLCSLGPRPAAPLFSFLLFRGRVSRGTDYLLFCPPRYATRTRLSRLWRRSQRKRRQLARLSPSLGGLFLLLIVARDCAAPSWTLTIRARLCLLVSHVKRAPV